MGNPLKELRAALGGLNSARIPTGVLLNRMLFITNPHRYAGQGDTTTSYRTFEQQYWEFYHAALDTTRFPTLATLQGRVAQRVQQGSVPLLMLSYTYNELAATAARDRLITIDSVNERVADGPDRSRSPYTTGQFFSVALPLPAAGGTLSLYVGPEFWLGTTAVPATVRLDFGDGYGARTVAMGSTIQVQITPAGLAGLTPAAPQPGAGTAGAGISYVPPPSVSSGSILLVSNPATGYIGAARLSATTLATTRPDVALGLVASRQWGTFVPPAGVVSGPNGRASAIAWIKYADDNPALPDGTHRLRHPLVFVEGIDFPAYRNAAGASGLNHYIAQTGPLPLSDFETGPAQQFGGYRNGTAGWNEMVDYNDGYKNLEQFPALRAQLQAPATQTFPNGINGGNYDIIYLDFSDGASLLQHNAMVLVELLQWINQPANRTADADETLVIGASMGGQVSRFALAWMEQQQLCHNSRLYVSFDSPHRGANVPLGLQYLFDRLQGAWIGAGSVEEVVHTKLLREATMQMIVFHFADMATPYRTAWQAWQASPGSYPSLLRKVAVANGSGQAAFPPDMSPGMLMLRTSVNPFRGTPYVVGTNFAYAMGRSDHTVLYWQRPFSIYQHTKTYDPNWGNYDTAPGSSERTAGDAQDVSGHCLVSGGNTNTFMPTISTLDVQDAGPINSPNFGYNVKNQIHPNDRPNRAKYAFDAYFAAGGVNEPHLQITNGQGSAYPSAYNTSYYTDNTTWIQNELRESAHRLPAALTTAYNFGSPYRHLLASVQVNAGGRLYLNNGSLPVSGGTPATQANPPQGNFDVYTSNCATVVQVNNSGQVAVGTGSTYTATLLLAANSLLDLRSGGQLSVSAGSVLRVAAGATLVVRQGASLNLSGRLLVEDGGFVCIENSASLNLAVTGQFSLAPTAHPYANPALGLTGLACQPPPCTASLYVGITGDCAGLPATLTASGDNLGTDYRWVINGQAQPQFNGQTEVNYTLPTDPAIDYLPVTVAVSSACAGPNPLQATSYFHVTHDADCANNLTGPTTESTATLYPNPAREAVEVHLSPGSAASASAKNPITVRLFDGQGRPRAEQQSHGEQVLRLKTDKLPAGLYFVHIMRGQQVLSRQQLKITQQLKQGRLYHPCYCLIFQYFKFTPMKIFHVFAVLLLALLGSCSQDPTTGTTTVSGQVVESVHQQPVANARAGSSA
ncbi:T9SS type A sorting domain-containing protein [Hymenobacter cheonanensis]|uniref:T9SS type A sorting domain-containing protein n=1 Tax=Hymenobacter sp. CA2-7 TaxID=3063993 RepID=UPI0027136E7B|nr:T9SS type A sorting domain-containing protein [Hymenobacter sp. CA2-7]MDO7885950.1 T9SS type A sorting domain-containing protein [Hymenobacter sp. CA2-7]